MVEASKEYKDHLCKVSFSSLSDYLWLLRASSQELSKIEKGRAMLYLAAAVSDFYIPREDLPQHKVQSSQGAPVVQLQLGEDNSLNFVKKKTLTDIKLLQ